MQRLDLLKPLTALGLPVGGDYSGLGRLTDAVRAGIQKVVVKVDQKGTEAAVATGVAVFTVSARTVPAHALVPDRPYLLMIQDTKTGTPLLLSRIEDPTRT